MIVDSHEGFPRGGEISSAKTLYFLCPGQKLKLHRRERRLFCPLLRLHSLVKRRLCRFSPGRHTGEPFIRRIASRLTNNEKNTSHYCHVCRFFLVMYFFPRIPETSTFVRRSVHLIRIKNGRLFPCCCANQ